MKNANMTLKTIELNGLLREELEIMRCSLVKILDLIILHLDSTTIKYFMVKV